jgi:P-type conjugative transfer protein TrbJ
MNNTFRNRLRNSAFSAALAATIFGVGFAVAPVPAYAIYCSNCSTFYQQMMEYAEQVNTAINTAEQLVTQTNQYNNMVEQGTALPDNMYTNMYKDMERVVSIYNRSTALGRNVANLDSQFSNQYPGYKEYYENWVRNRGMSTGSINSMTQQYEQWSTNGRDNIKTSMQAANMNTSTFEDENTQLTRIVDKSQSAVGRQQAIQAGNQIASFTVQQLQKLRDLMATQMNMQANYMAQEQARSELDDAVRAGRRSAAVKNTAANKEY